MDIYYEQVLHGRYHILARLAEGGMGITYRAWDASLGIPVVVKTPRLNGFQSRTLRDNTLKRFRLEILLMQALAHKHIVPITGNGEHKGVPFAVMRFLPGGSAGRRPIA